MYLRFGGAYVLYAFEEAAGAGAGEKEEEEEGRWWWWEGCAWWTRIGRGLLMVGLG